MYDTMQGSWRNETMVETRFLQNTWVEISESAYANNLKFFRKIIGSKPELSVVLKANAYGHGWQSIARLAAKHGADSFCVHSLDEAIRLRRAGFNQNILMMGHVPIANLDQVIENNLRLVVFNRETIEALHELTSNKNKLARIHLKLETGTNRHGVDQDELDWYLQRLRETPGILFEAVYTHFANVEDTTSHEFADFQRYRFRQMVEMIHKSGFPIIKQHMACTAAAMLFKNTHHDMIRLGIGQYGIWPSGETRVSYQGRKFFKVDSKLQPVLTWKTRVGQLKWAEADSTVGYGRTFKTTRRTRIAVLPVGYSDGYDRGLSNCGVVLVKGKRAAVLGRICMNLMMVDVTDIPDVELEDEVVLLGKQGEEEIPAEWLADLCGTIGYEVLARINSEITRIIV
ncbi:MAG: alanine racemase [Calditrichota bacterium]